MGFTNGTNTIDGCKVNVRVEVNNVGNQHVGGVVGHGKNSTLTIKNTSFGGHLVNHGDYAGGLRPRRPTCSILLPSATRMRR